MYVIAYVLKVEIFYPIFLVYLFVHLSFYNKLDSCLLVVPNGDTHSASSNFAFAMTHSGAIVT